MAKHKSVEATQKLVLWLWFFRINKQAFFSPDSKILCRLQWRIFGFLKRGISYLTGWVYGRLLGSDSDQPSLFFFLFGCLFLPFACTYSKFLCNCLNCFIGLKRLLISWDCLYTTDECQSSFLISLVLVSDYEGNRGLCFFLSLLFPLTRPWNANPVLGWIYD